MKPRFTIVYCLLWYCLLSSAWAQTYTLETIPNPKQNPSSHYVSNPDRILSTRAVAQIDAILGALEDSTTAQVAVVFVNSIGEQVPKDFATALFKKWGIGYDKKDNGLLMLLVKDKRRMEFETGFGLEGILPDAICKRIQTEKMVPYAKQGDYDQAVVEGVKAVSELIMKPASAKEVYDETKFTGTPAPTDPFLHEGDYGMLAIVFTFFMGLFRGITAFFHSASPTKMEVSKAIGQKKGRILWAFLLYLIIPIGVFVGLIILNKTILIEFWQALIGMYVYAVFVIWDSRLRREKVFDELYGSLSEPERYVRHREMMRAGWLKAILFPVPFGWLYVDDKKRLDSLRNHPRTSAAGHELTKVSDTQKDNYLTPYQRVEENLKTNEYDIWRNEVYNETVAVAYPNIAQKQYTECNQCQSVAMSLASNEVVKAATLSEEGRGANHYECKACGHHRQVDYTIPRQKERQTVYVYDSSSSSSNSSGSWGSSSDSSSSSSDSSFGGGDSGGGGSGSDW
ncbi:MAG: TPM domain-containing protein [Spirosomataceae bacterium]